jgi:uncharacterized protein YdhG (YjbR/CyaY superfamily)
MTEATTTEATLRETVEQFVKENNMEAIIERMVQQAERVQSVEANKDQIVNRLQEERNTSRNNRDTVRNKFREMLDGDKNATIEMDLDDINELLEDIGASKIIFTYSVDVTVTATITGIEADSAEEARDKAIAALELSVDTNSLGEDANCEDEDYEADNAQEEDN